MAVEREMLVKWNMKSKMSSIGCVCAAFLMVLLSCIPLFAEDLATGFRTPPPSAGIRCFWWWLNGNVTAEAITRDLEAMKAKGFSGALIFDADGSGQRKNSPVPAGPAFGSPAWTKLFVHACREAVAGPRL